MAPRRLRYAAPGLGVGEVWLDGDMVVWSELPRPAREGPVDAAAGDGLGADLCARLGAFFAGEAVSFDDVALDLEWATPFERALAGALRAVPRGATVTYGELAARAGRPRAARAAGTFCARNRFGPFLPCHRVVAADGIGGYGSLGVDYKRRLLALEVASLPPAAR